MIRRTFAAVAVCLAVGLALRPGVAGAHAQLLSDSPRSGAVVGREPRLVTFTFGESVGIDGEAVRVFDSAGRQVDTGPTIHPGGRGPTVGVRLRPDLPHGTYTATYRVVSADTHIVTGGFVFSIGAPGATGGASVTRLLSGERAGGVTDTAFAAARGVQYAAIGVGGGLLAFLVLCWLPALEGAGLTPDRWRGASARSVARLRVALAIVAGAGVLSALAGIALQGALARGIDVWHALDATTVSDVLPTRFGTVWGAGLIAWLVVLVAAGGLLRAAPRLGLVPRPATLGATGVALRSARARWPLAALAAPLAALVLLPAFAGHATLQHPVALFAPLNVLHVCAMTLWLGGLVGLLLAAVDLRAAHDPAATRVLAGALARFSPIALGCVALLIATGVGQALIEVSAWSELIDTPYGRAIVVKACLLTALIVLGARQRSQTMPAVEARVRADAAPGPSGRRLLATVAAELALLAGVLGAVGALSGSAPAHEAGRAAAGAGSSAANGSGMSGMSGMSPSQMRAMGGPSHITTTLGRAQAIVSVTPGSVGPAHVTVTLSRAGTIEPFTATRQLTVTASLPARNLGPLTLRMRRTGPGRYASTGAVLGAPGRWALQITDRTSEFDESQRTVSVPIQ